MTMLRVRDARADGHVALAGRGAVAHVSSSLLSILLFVLLCTRSVYNASPERFWLPGRSGLHGHVP